MGESLRLETAITVTGLKPGHYYNVRVIAVGANHFQSGSSVLRLRTLGRNGRPKLEGCNDSSNPSDDEEESSEHDDPGGARRNPAGIEAAALPEGSQAAARDQSSGNISQRRNTVGRKHSQSTAGADQATRELAVSSQPGESMNQLAEKFEAIRRETDEVTAQMAKDTEEYRANLAELVRDRDEKKQILKEKEAASEALKREAVNSERLNRVAQNNKTQKDNILASKEAARAKRQDDMARWKKEIEGMRLEREAWREEQENLKVENESKAEELRGVSATLQQTIKSLEEDIHQKGLQIRELEEERSQLPGAQNDAETRERDENDKLEDLQWETTEKTLLEQLNSSSMQLREIGHTILQGQNHLSLLQASSPMMYHANSSGVDFDPTGAGKAKSRRTRNRKSRTNTISSPIAAYPIIDSAFPSASAYNNINNTTSPTFAPGPYIDMNNHLAMVPLSEHLIGMSEEDIRSFTAGAPLSPTATSLLPSNIFADDDPPSPGAESSGSFGPALYDRGMPSNKDAQSPGSSSRSASHMSSPQNSAHNLALYGVSSYGGDNERRSLNSPRTDFGAIGSPGPSEQIPHKGLRDLFTLPSRTKGKAVPEDGLALGSLKHGQSQSFPRSLEEPDTLANRARRMSFTSNWPVFGRRGVTTGDSSIQGNAPAPARNPGTRRRRGFNMFSNSMDENSIHSERDPSSPRPVSIASSGPGELPRPSTDSAPFGWAPAPDALINRNSPLATNWSVNAPPTWSRNPSRRPSLQQGSTTALTNGIASDDDEFLPPSDGLGGHSSPSATVGVIGTRPPSSHKPITPKLNPAAPAFKGLIFRTSNSEKDKNKAKSKPKVTEPVTPNEIEPSTSSSPTASRKSRDTHSIHTQNSVAESYDSLDKTSSNTPSEAATPGATAKEKESASSLRELLRRKGSSSKFSLSSFRNIGGKKGTGSAANSDRNASVERDGSFDEYSEDTGLGRSVDSVTSSPMIGSNASGEWSNKLEKKETNKEGRMSMNWGRFGIKKGKGRESSEVDRSEGELATEDEG